jgi:23S rRNA maturation mini-RNase III
MNKTSKWKKFHEKHIRYYSTQQGTKPIINKNNPQVKEIEIMPVMSTEQFIKVFFDLPSDYIISEEEMKNYNCALIHPDNKKLAYVGDAFLNLVLKEHYYLKGRYDLGAIHNVLCGTDKQAGIASNRNLSSVASRYNFYAYLTIVGHDSLYYISEKIYATAFEAMIGAYYLAHGLDETKKVVLKLLIEDN